MAYEDEYMAFGYDCPKLLRYSNPRLSDNGTPAGILSGEWNEADNRREINENRHYIANFK